jgi:predicted esterase
MLHEEIGRLPDRYRTPVVLCYLEALTHEVAARQLGWPIGTVGVRLMRARERLRTSLISRRAAPPMAVLPPLAPPGEPLGSSLTTQTTNGVMSFISRNAPALSPVPLRVASIAIEVLRTMAIKKVVGAVAAVLVCGVITAGTVLAVQPPAARPGTARPPNAPAAVREPEEAKSILTNGGFEKGDTKTALPEAWKKGAKLSGVEYQWDRNVAHQGRSSLHLRKTAQRYFPIAQWFQEVKRSGATARLKLSAFVKAKKMTKAILDVQFEGRDGAQTHQWAAYIGAKEDGEPPATHDWKRYAGIVEIPEGTQKIIVAMQIYGPGEVWFDDITADYTEEKAADSQASIPPTASPVGPDADVADVKLEERNAAADPRKRYFLIGPSSPPAEPERGHKLLLLLSGGDGGTGFQTFARWIAKNALPPDYLLAELVAVSWTPEQAAEIVWPTTDDKLSDAGLTTEQFIDDVIADVMVRKKVDPRYIFVLGWSSGGPPVYASSLRAETRITGWFVAMSVFRPEKLPPLDNGKGRAFYLYHSPEDSLCPYAMAEAAAQALRSGGATVQLTSYSGGHGWRGPVYDDIRTGIAWLEEHQANK